jgi:dihydrofolate synthase/folylpolyglutamate synthase
VFIRKAEEEKASISFASELFEAKGNRNGELLNIEITRYSPLTTHHLQLDLPGSYQLKNVKTVLLAVDELRQQGYTITDEHIKTALKQVKTLTGLHGRWETISQNPLTICDTGHNPEGIAEVLKNIATVTYNHLHFVLGMVNDKDISKVLSMLPTDATYYFCRPDIPRGLEADSLKEKAESFGLHGEAYANVKAALAAAQQSAQPNDLVFAGGSTFVVAEVV